MRPKQGAPNGSDARCDFYLKNADIPLAAVIEGYKRKMSRYFDNYAELNSSNFKPLVFDMYGGWHEDTKSFLKMIVEVLLDVDGQFEKLWRELRNRVAVAIATGQGELLLALNAKQRSSVKWQNQHNQGRVLEYVQETEAE